MTDRPTIKDVANAAGVSAQAVSLVINERPGVSDAKRAEILEAIERLDYTPRAWARAMRGASTRTLAFIYPGTRHGRLSASGYLEEILNGVLAAANAHGYSILLYALRGKDENGTLRSLEQGSRVDGIITAVSETSQPQLELLERLKLPIVEVQRQTPAAYAVLSDDASGTRSAVGYLVRRGHKHIAYLSRTLSTYASRERHRGYLEGLAAHGLQADEALIRYAEHSTSDSIVPARRDEPWEITQGLELTLELLARPEPPTAVLCFDDMLAVGALRAARLRNLRVPADLAVIGYNNFSLAAALDPPLTTVEFPAYELGASATELLIDLLAGQAPDKREIILPVKLVVRSSA